MTTFNSNTHALLRFAPNSGRPGWLANAFATFDDWIKRSRARDELGQMDERLLKDIGLTPADVTAETDKHFWQH